MLDNAVRYAVRHVSCSSRGAADVGLPRLATVEVWPELMRHGFLRVPSCVIFSEATKGTRQNSSLRAAADARPGSNTVVHLRSSPWAGACPLMPGLGT